MAVHSLRRLTRNAEAPQLFESFLIAAVAAFLGIRWFLALTDYPRVGSGGIHIAHMFGTDLRAICRARSPAGLVA